jgi:hypothetical protein
MGLSAMTALELIVGAKNQRDVELISRLTEAYQSLRFPHCSHRHRRAAEARHQEPQAL